FWQKLFIEFDEFEKRGGIGGGSSNNWKPRGTKAYKNETESDETFTKLPSYEEFITERKESIRTVFWDLAGQAFHPDMLLLRYLNGYGWDVDKCLRRLMRTLQWRFEEDIGYLIWYGEMDVFQQLLKTGLTFTYGQDKLGYPVVYIRVKFNTPSKFKFEDRERIVYWCLETLQLFSRYTDHKATFVFDLTDYTTENVELKLVKTLVSAFATNYPETLKELIVYVNSWFFP
ncbi:phosphatidylinositol transfer protein csr1, partial [Spiromyces aspiralis]